MTAAAAIETRRARQRVLISRLGGALLRLLASTWRIRYVNRGPFDALRAAGSPVVMTLWHGDLLPLLWVHRREGITVLISEHGDGEIVARVALSLGYRTVRGSTSRGGARALLGISRVLDARGDVAFTPDGPRGPAHTYAPGALIVAQRTGAPVVPLAASAARCWRLSSWDSFLIPKPFARVTVAYGNPVRVEAATVREAAAQARRFQALQEQTSAAATHD